MKIDRDIRDDIALITMDDGKMNAITRAAMTDLNAALDKAEADARAVVLAGRPGSFCAGFHLPTMQGDDQETTRELSLAGGHSELRCPLKRLARLGDEFLETVEIGDPISVHEDGTVEIG